MPDQTAAADEWRALLTEIVDARVIDLDGASLLVQDSDAACARCTALAIAARSGTALGGDTRHPLGPAGAIGPA